MGVSFCKNPLVDNVIRGHNLLGWPKISFRFLCKMKQTFGQQNIFIGWGDVDTRITATNSESKKLRILEF